MFEKLGELRGQEISLCAPDSGPVGTPSPGLNCLWSFVEPHLAAVETEHERTPHQNPGKGLEIVAIEVWDGTIGAVEKMESHEGGGTRAVRGSRRRRSDIGSCEVPVVEHFDDTIAMTEEHNVVDAQVAMENACLLINDVVD